MSVPFYSIFHTLEREGIVKNSYNHVNKSLHCPLAENTPHFSLCHFWGILTLLGLPNGLQWIIIYVDWRMDLGTVTDRKLQAISYGSISQNFWIVSHHKDYPVHLLILGSRLEKIPDDILKVIQKESHTYSFDHQKRKSFGAGHTGGSKESACSPEPWLTRHLLLVLTVGHVIHS